MKKILNSILLLNALFVPCAIANDLKVKNQDVSPAQLQKQNTQITELAAAQISKDLPQVINKYTTITDIQAIGAKLIYIYEIKTGAKSDKEVMAEDRTKWEKLYIANVCKRSKRFLDAQVHLSYVYNSEKTKVKLFQFDVTQAKCFKLNGYK